MATTQTPTLSPIDAERNDARDSVRFGSMWAIFFFGLFLMVLALFIAGAMTREHEVWPLFAVMSGLLVLLAASGSHVIECFMIIQDQQLSELRAIAANTHVAPVPPQEETGAAVLHPVGWEDLK